MLFAIKVYEYGVSDYHVDYFNSKDDAEEIARSLAYQLMDDYPLIFDAFSQEAELEGLEPNTEEFDNFIDECYEENAEYQIYKINEELIPEDMSTDDLEKLFYDNEKDFIARYCETI